MMVYRLEAVVFSFLWVGLCLLPAFSEGIPNNPSSIQGQGPDGSLYTIQAGLHGEIYPVFANYASFQTSSQRRFGVITITISNPAPAFLRRTISVQIPGWSDQEMQAAELEGGATRTLVFAPTFLPRFYRNREIVAATANISVADMNGGPAYQTTVPVRLRSCEDIFWGEDFQYARFIASWVTPHDSLVESLLARARQYTADRRLPGYEDWKTSSRQEMETYREARAIFTALQRSSLSYVKSSLTLGEHARWSERVRLPRVSLSNGSANCIDAAVLYASLFENLGMDAEVVLVPGHAYAGVRVAATSGTFLLIDAALTGRSTFEAAVASAQRGISRLQSSSVIEIKISQARAEGIYPFPSPAQ
jgi:hypothetical protein